MSRLNAKFYTMTLTAGHGGGKSIMAPLGSAGDGNIYLPAECSGRSPTEVFLCASYDGEPVVVPDGKHAFYRSAWLKALFPVRCV